MSDGSTDHGAAARAASLPEQETSDTNCTKNGISNGGGRRRRARRPLLLYTPEDDAKLSDLICLTRQQIEVFAATPADIAARISRGGSKQRFDVGRVGIRCVHCSHLPAKEQAKGAASYPASVRIMHQAVRNWQRYHFGRCDWMPEEVRARYADLKGGVREYSSKTSTEHWARSCERMGLVDGKEGRTGIFFVGDYRRSDDESESGDDTASVAGDGDDNNEIKNERSPGASAGGAPPVDLLPPTAPTSQFTDADGPALATDMEVPGSQFLAESSTDGLNLNRTAQHEDGSDLVPIDASGGNANNLDWSEYDLPSLKPEEERSGFMRENGSGVPPVTHPFVGPELTENSFELLQPSVGIARSEGSQRSGSTDRLMEQVRRAHELVKASLEIKLVPQNQSDASRATDSERYGQDDLFSLGIDLYKLFADCDPFQDSDSRTTAKVDAVFEGLHVTDSPQKKREKKSVAAGAFRPLRDYGFPISLCSLVSNLLGESSNDHFQMTKQDRYHTLDEVQGDLRLMISDPERYLFDASADKLSGQLGFPPGKLYGREQDVSRLMGVFDRVVGSESPSEMVVINGYSGTGKSVLVDQVRRPLSERNGHFISGKFDKLGQVQPMLAVFTAFNDFCGNLLQGGQGQLIQTRMSIDKALGPNVNALTGLIPNLGSVMGVTNPSPFDIGGKEALNRFLFYFGLFVRAIASPSHPVVLFLDDLQWADKSALDLITTLVLDREARSLLFVGCYRENEVGLGHLNVAIANIAMEAVAITVIKLENLDRESVTGLISDTLQLSPPLCRSLANIVYAKTGGNPLFAVQFLRSLYDEKLLHFSASSRRWEWDVEAIQAKDIADNVVDLMMQKMIRMDPNAQKLLKESACLGSRFETSTLNLLGSDENSDGSTIELILDLAVDEGLMCRIGSSYKFSHDQIQQAAYSLIPASEQEALHLCIGRRLRRRASDEELKNMIFIVVDQLHRGSDLLTDHDEKVDVASLCLKAGEVAMQTSAFTQASLYLLQGTVLLDESDWESQYNLCLRLFCACAEAQYVAGNYQGVTLTLNPVWKHGRSLQDKLRGYHTLMNSLGVQGKQFDAIAVGLRCLAELGESFPEEIQQSDNMSEFAKTETLLRGTSIDGILQMNVMEDAKKVAVMTTLDILTRYMYQVNQSLMSMIAFRMIQLSLCHGISKKSAMAFSWYGIILCTLDQLEQGRKYGKLALSLLDRFNDKEHLPRVFSAVHGLINTATEPMQACLPSQKHGYEVGMSVGDIEWALTNANIYVLCGIQSGSNLEPLAEETKAYIQQMKEYKHHMLTMILPHYQLILNLMGCSENPTELTGEAMDQDELLNECLEKGLFSVANMMYFFRMWLAYLFRRYGVAADMVTRRKEMSEVRPFRLETIVNEIFYTGLIAVAMMREDNQGEWRDVALDAARKMETWVAHSKWNFEHKAHLLNAEIAYYVNEDVDAARKAYDGAIRSAGEHGFIHEQGLACERAGIFYTEKFSPLMAAEYFEQSHKCYIQWGAKSKAEDDLLSGLVDK